MGPRGHKGSGDPAKHQANKCIYEPQPAVQARMTSRRKNVMRSETRTKSISRDWHCFLVSSESFHYGVSSLGRAQVDTCSIRRQKAVRQSSSLPRPLTDLNGNTIKTQIIDLARRMVEVQ